MAKKPAPKSAAKKIETRPAVTPPASVVDGGLDTPIAETPVRKTVKPKAAPSVDSPAAAPAKKAPAPITYERIAERAYYISQSGYGGSQDDNWHRAEAELKNEGL